MSNLILRPNAPNIIRFGRTGATTISSSPRPPVSSSQYTNEPLGLVTPWTITATQPNSFDVLPRLYQAADGLGHYDLDTYGWVIEAGFDESGDPTRWTIVNDAERGNVLNLELRATDSGGIAPGGGAVGGFGHAKSLSYHVSSSLVAKELFVGYWVKLSPNWETYNVAMKHMYFLNGWTTLQNPAATASDGNWYLNLSSNTYPYLNGGYQIQNTGYATQDWYGPSASVSRGVWHKFEMYAQFNSAASASDGILKVWFDDVLMTNFSNLPLGWSGRDFDWLKFGIITGGGSNAVGFDGYARFDDYYVKVGPGQRRYYNEPTGLIWPDTIPSQSANPFDYKPRIWDAADGKANYALDSYGWCLEEGDITNNCYIYNDSIRGNVLRSRFPAGLAGGNSPYTAMMGYGHGDELTNYGDYTKLFVGFWVRLSDNWVDENLGTKLVFSFSKPSGSAAGSDGSWNINLTDQTNTYLKGGILEEHAGVGNYSIFESGSAGRGVWTKYEYYIELNTAGNANGVLKVWRNGMLTCNTTNAEQINTARNLSWLKMSMTYGGGSTPVPEDMYIDLDDWYVKVGT